MHEATADGRPSTMRRRRNACLRFEVLYASLTTVTPSADASAIVRIKTGQPLSAVPAAIVGDWRDPADVMLPRLRLRRFGGHGHVVTRFVTGARLRRDVVADASTSSQHGSVWP